MNRRTFAAAALSLVMVASAALHASAAPVLNVYYTGSTGNIKVQNTTSSSVPVQSINLITLGNGTQGVVSGLPGNIGYLNGSAATMPSGAFLTSNTNSAGLNGIYSQVYAANVGSAMFTLSPYAGWSASDPIGPVGSYWDLGNIAPTGLTQADIDTYFLTDFEITPPDFETSAYGKFLFTYEISPGEFSADTIGDVKVVPQGVPEPSTFAMLISAVACGGWMAGRGKSRSAKIAGFSAGRGTFRDVGGIRTVGCAT